VNKRLLTYTSYLYLLTYAFTVTSMGPCNAPVAREFGLGENLMGMLFASHFAGFIISVFFAGYMVDRVGLRPVMLAAIVVLALAMIGFGAAWNVPVAFFMMFMTGIGGGGVEAGVNSLISRMYSDTRVYSLNLMHTYFGVGAFTWPAFAGWMLASGTSWRVLFFIIGGVSLAIAALLFPQKFPGMEAGSETVGIRDMLKLLRSPTVLLVGLVIAFYVGGEMGINNWIVRYFDEILLEGEPLAEHFGINAGITSSIFLTLYWFTMTVGRLGATIAGRFMRDVSLLRIMAVSSTVCAIATFMVDGVAAAAVFLGLTGLFFSGIFATTIATGGNRFPDRLGTISGIVIGFSGIGNVGFNAAIGSIAQAAGLRAGMLFAAGTLVLMSLCALLIPAPKTR